MLEISYLYFYFFYLNLISCSGNNGICNIKNNLIAIISFGKIFIVNTDLYILEQYFNFLGDDFTKYCQDFKNSVLKETFMFLLFMILIFFKNIFIFATIEKMTPFHYLIILVIGELSSSIKNIIDKSIIENILIIICFCIITFMILVFNEIIELKCYGLNKNTKKGISDRAELDKSNKEMRNESIFSESDRETIREEIND